MYSQNDEESHILSIFGEETPGHFLDIGAWNGKLLSNTYRLTELGWSGVCVEPSPTPFAELLKLHGGNDKIVLLNAAIMAQSGVVRFFDSNGDAISTTSTDHVKKWEAGYAVEYKPFLTHGLGIAQFFEHFGLGFDFLNLDVESANVELFGLMPFDLMPKLRCICVEHDGFHAEMADRVAPLGFTVVTVNAENLILKRDIE